MNNHKFKINYRPEIDGLRAVSVFAVILYHADFFFFNRIFFQGGYIGVDIFFVISGYLITTLILKEITKTNQFSFKYFYERRIRRILPLLLFVLIVTSIISYFILIPSSLMDFGKSILSIIFFSSNFYFNYTSSLYGHESSLLIPLLHTWSLSVEEQFYILFPIFLLIIFKYFQKHVLKIILLFFLISLCVAHILANTSLYQLFNFYLLPSRIFELLIGSMLSYFELRNKELGGSAYRKSYSILYTLCPSVGFILILYSFLSSFFNFKTIAHPSIITLIPLIGASLIIWFSKKGEVITEILSSKIFVFFGLISYSLYLWHYPIFAFLRYFDIFEKSIIVKLCAILLTILISIFSYYFIERPFRKKKIISLKTLTIYILISVIILLSYSVYILNTEGIKKRYNNIYTEKLTYNIKSNEFYKTNSTDNKIYLIGDSHANSLIYYLNQVSRNQSYSFYNNYTHLYLHDFNQIYRKNNNIESSYFETNERIDKFLTENKNLIVVWNQRWVIKTLENYIFPNEKNEKTEFYFEPVNHKNSTLEERQTYIAEGIKSSIKYILDKGHILILIYPIPEHNFNPKIRLGIGNMWHLFNNKKKQIEIYGTDYLIFKQRNKIVFDILDSVQSPNIFRIYPDKFFCNTLIVNRCIANNKETLFYSDDNHLSLNGLRYITNSIEKIIGEINYFDKK